MAIESDILSLLGEASFSNPSSYDLPSETINPSSFLATRLYWEFLSLNNTNIILGLKFSATGALYVDSLFFIFLESFFVLLKQHHLFYLCSNHLFL